MELEKIDVKPSRPAASVSRIAVLLAVLVMTVAGCGDPLPVVEGDLAFVGVNVLPMAGPGGPVLLENQTVVVSGRRIASINPAGEVDLGDGVEVIQAAGQYLMPGLAEMHGHLPSRLLLPADARNLMFLFVANGVTTVRGVQDNQSHFTLRDQIARGEVIAPRLFLGSPAMGGESVTTPEQAEQLVREYRQSGYDLIEVDEGLALEVYDVMAARAIELGIRLGGHVPDEVGLLRALDAGQASFDHLDNYLQALVPEDHQPAALFGQGGVGALLDVIDEDRLSLLVDATRAAGARVVPTMVLWEAVLFGSWPASELRAERPELRYMPPETVDAWEQAVDDRLAGADRVVNRRVRELRRTILQALHKGGVSLLLGTDAPQIFNVPGFAMHHEMALWVELGMTPYEVLETGTRGVAEYFDAADDFGSVAVGHRADLLLLTANPIEDIGNVARRAGVMVNGRWLSEAQIQDRLASIATFYGN